MLKFTLNSYLENTGSLFPNKFRKSLLHQIENKAVKEERENEQRIEKLKRTHPLFDRNLESEKIQIYDPAKLFKAGNPKSLLPNYVEDKKSQQTIEIIQLNKVPAYIAISRTELPENNIEEVQKKTFTTFGK